MSQEPDILKQYIERIKNNVQQAIKIQDLVAKTCQCVSGDWLFRIYQENDTISESMTLTIKEKNVPVLAPEEAIKNKVLELSREIILDSDQNFHNSKKNKFEYYSGLNETDKKEFDDKVDQYIAAHISELEFEATKQLLIANGVMPKIVNRALQESACTAKKMNILNDSQISVENDEGYCAKSLFIPLYEFKDRYGGFEWLPDSAETVAHPLKIVEYLQLKKPNYITEKNVLLNSNITNYEAGSIVMVDQGNGHMHAMMYNGLNEETGKPQYIGFNSNDLNRGLSDKRVGIIINIPQMIKDDSEKEEIKEQDQTVQVQAEIKRLLINVPELQMAPSLKLLSRGQKAEYVSLRIARELKEKVK